MQCLSSHSVRIVPLNFYHLQHNQLPHDEDIPQVLPINIIERFLHRFYQLINRLTPYPLLETWDTIKVSQVKNIEVR